MSSTEAHGTDAIVKETVVKFFHDEFGTKVEYRGDGRRDPNDPKVWLEFVNSKTKALVCRIDVGLPMIGNLAEALLQRLRAKKAGGSPGELITVDESEFVVTATISYLCNA